MNIANNFCIISCIETVFTILYLQCKGMRNSTINRVGLEG